MINKKRNKNSRTTGICCLESVTTTRRFAFFGYLGYLPSLFSLPYSISRGVKPSIKLIRETSQLIHDYKRLKSDNHYQVKRETNSENMVKNWHHTDKCVPLHRVNHQIAKLNKHIRRLLKSITISWVQCKSTVSTHLTTMDG